MPTSPVIATHDGPFHADDLLAVLIAQAKFPSYELCRTRDLVLLHEAQLRLDVGGRYAPLQGDFDHHFTPPPTRPDSTPYAACGLVWAAYGPDLLAAQGASDPETAALIVDHLLFHPVDLEDTGTSQGPMHALVTAIWDQNPTWLESRTATEAFIDLVTYLRPAFRALLHSSAHDSNNIPMTISKFEKTVVALNTTRQRAIEAARTEAYDLVKTILQSSQSPLLEVPNSALPVSSILHAAEEATGRTVTHILAPSPDGTWLLTAAPSSPGSFESRLKFPKTWSGLRDHKLATVTGIPGAVFCHPGCWITGWHTRAAALAASRLALLPTVTHAPR